MKRIRIKNLNGSYPEDVKRIGKILFEKGYWGTPDECQTLWEMYSDDLCAGWLILPEDDELVYKSIRPYIDDPDDVT